MSAASCPVHGIPDCSPLLNGCSQLTSRHPDEPLYNLDTHSWSNTCPCITAQQRDPECPFHGREEFRADAATASAPAGGHLVEQVQAICNAVEYRVPGKHDTWDAYHEGQSALADQVLTTIDSATPPAVSASMSQTKVGERVSVHPAMLTCAVRYALGRQSYMPAWVCEEVQRVHRDGTLPEKERAVIVRDIQGWFDEDWHDHHNDSPWRQLLCVLDKNGVKNILPVVPDSAK